MVLVFGVVGVCVLMFLSAIWSGYALSILWGCFIVPTFGLPQISVATAIGLALVVGYMARQYQGNTRDESFGDTLGHAAMFSILKPAFALAIGWVITKFI